MTDYNTFKTQVRRELEEATAGVWAEDSLLSWTNEATLDIAKRAETQEEHTYTASVANQQTYDLPDYTLEIKRLLYNDVALDRVPIGAWPQVNQAGSPSVWDVVNRAICLYPTPTTSATLTIFRRRSPEPIATVSATTPMPFEDRHNALIKNYVKAQAMAQVTDLNSFNMYMQEYERGITEAWQQERNEELSQVTFGSPLEVW